jgi:hypothetical protein
MDECSTSGNKSALFRSVGAEFGALAKFVIGIFLITHSLMFMFVFTYSSYRLVLPPTLAGGAIGILFAD